MAPTSPATTPSSSRFKLFLFSRRTNSDSAVSALLADDRSPLFRKEASRSSLRVWQSGESGSSEALDTARSVQTYNTMRVRAPPSSPPPPPSRAPLAGPRTSYPTETHKHLRDRERQPTFTSGLCTPPRSRSPRRVGGERNVSLSANGLRTDDSAAHWQRPCQQGRRHEQSPQGRATALESPPNVRRHGKIYSATGVSLCTPSHHARDADRAEDSPADENEINLEDYPWFMCRLVSGVNVKMDLKVQGGSYWV